MLGIVEQSGGGVHVESQLGVGTSVLVLLPRAEGPIAHQPATRPVAPSCGGESVLAVEDDPQVRAVLARMLLGSGYELLLAANGAEALAIAGARPGGVDVLVTDVVMAGMSGLDVARALRHAHPRLAVVFSSGFADVPVGEIEAVASAPLLAKPYTQQAVVNAVQAALDHERSRHSDC